MEQSYVKKTPEQFRELINGAEESIGSESNEEQEKSFSSDQDALLELLAIQSTWRACRDDRYDLNEVRLIDSSLVERGLACMKQLNLFDRASSTNNWTSQQLRSMNAPRDPMYWLTTGDGENALRELFLQEFVESKGRLLTYAKENWSRDTDKFRAAELVANGPIEYDEFVRGMWPGARDKSERNKLFCGLCQKIRDEVPGVKLVRAPKALVREVIKKPQKVEDR